MKKYILVFINFVFLVQIANSQTNNWGISLGTGLVTKTNKSPRFSPISNLRIEKNFQKLSTSIGIGFYDINRKTPLSTQNDYLDFYETSTLQFDFSCQYQLFNSKWYQLKAGGGILVHRRDVNRFSEIIYYDNGILKEAVANNRKYLLPGFSIRLDNDFNIFKRILINIWGVQSIVNGRTTKITDIQYFDSTQFGIGIKFKL
jgi:hypothetical protein